MAAYYALSYYNSKKREWVHQTTTTTIKGAKERAKSESSMTKTKWRIVKEETLYVFDSGKIVNK